MDTSKLGPMGQLFADCAAYGIVIVGRSTSYAESELARASAAGARQEHQSDAEADTDEGGDYARRPGGIEFVAAGDTDAAGAEHSDDEAIVDADDEDAEADDFVAARNKLEAVNRLSAAVGGGEERLGPGSTERKSVLEGLGEALGLRSAQLPRTTKTKLAGSLAEELGVPWDAQCISTGETITLRGLNRLLQGAERRFPREGTADTPRREAQRIAEVIEPILRGRGRFDLRSAVTDMREAASGQWRQQQWQGWYFEHITLGPCFGRLRGEPKKSMTGTTFDYSRTFIWDFKAHSNHERTALLNDAAATFWALGQGGLGFVILNGEAETEPWAKSWQDEQKALYPSKHRRRDRVHAEDPSAGGGPKVKSAFLPTRLDFFFFPDRAAWDAGSAAGMFGEFQKGFVNSDGVTPRNMKFKMNMTRALRSEYFLFSIDLTRPSS